MVAHTGSSNPFSSATRLANVCRGWRRIALSTGRLWAGIRVRIGAEADMDRHMKITKICLKRSRECSLHIKIQADIDIAPLMDIILPHSNRWHLLELQAPLSAHRSLKKAKGEFASLAVLQLSIRDLRGPVRVDELRDAFSNAPLLKHVALTPPLRLPVMELPWDQLKSWVGILSVDEVASLSERAPNLESLMFLDSQSVSTTPVHQAQPMTRLKSLHLSFNSSPASVNNLPDMPSLTALRIQQPVWLPASPGPLLSLVQRLPKCLTSFAYQGGLQLSVLTRMLSYLPNVTHLSLAGVSGDPILLDIFHQLTYNPRVDVSQCPLPRLETCTFEVSDKISERTLLSFLHSRWFIDSDLKPARGNDKVSALRSANVTHQTHNPDMTSSLKARIYMLRSQGLDVRVTLGNESIPEKDSVQDLTNTQDGGVDRDFQDTLLGAAMHPWSGEDEGDEDEGDPAEWDDEVYEIDDDGDGDEWGTEESEVDYDDWVD
ncbi:hypothetical protein AX16_004900 [Volvariella volvacea WC 439]|nr:hypothetical protein AX16_004900 [Volvariella volvacea WC 439]